jgi:hypothetical protein
LCGDHRRQQPSGACSWRAGDNGCTSRKGGIGRTSDEEAAAARLGETSKAPHLAAPATESRDLEGSCDVPGNASGRALRLRGLAVVRSEAADERIRVIGREMSG